jgi:hypothetical protein
MLLVYVLVLHVLLLGSQASRLHGGADCTHQDHKAVQAL